MSRTLRIALIVAGLVVGTALFLVIRAADKESSGYIGVYPGEVTSDIASDYGVQAGQGVIVEGVSSDSPAEEIGLRENDVIIKLNGQAITGPAEFRNQLAKFKVGDTVDLQYLRGGQTRTASVKLAERKDRSFGIWKDNGDKEFHFEGFPWDWRHGESSKKIGYAGIMTDALSEGLAKYFKVEKGVLISEVVKDSPAEKAGLKAGDVIIRIGDKDIKDEEDVRKAIRRHKSGDEVDFFIMRDGQQQTVKVTLGEQDAFGGAIDLGDFDGDWLGKMMVPDPDKMEELHQKLKEIEIKIEDLPGIDNDTLIIRKSPHIRMEMLKARPMRIEIGTRMV